MTLSFNSKPNPNNTDGSSVNKAQPKAIKSTSKNSEEDEPGLSTNPDAQKTTFDSNSNFNAKKMFNDFLGKNNPNFFPSSSSTINSQPSSPWLGSGASSPSLGSSSSLANRSTEKLNHGSGANNGIDKGNPNLPDLPRLPKKDVGETDPLVPNPDGVKLTQSEFDVIRYTNALRQAAGKDPLIVKADLIDTARLSSERMDASNQMKHGMTSGWSRENIAAGQGSAEEVMNSWKNSPGHYSNIMSDDIKYIGVGDTKEADGAVYWTQQFL